MEKNKSLNKKLIADEALKAMQEIEKETRLENIIKDNKIIFKVGEKTFRLRLPTVEEQEEIDSVRRKKYIELVDDSSYLFRKQWIEKYKNKGIDISKMEGDIRDKIEQVRKNLLKLAEAKLPKDIADLKTKIDTLRREIHDINLQKTDLMANSIEDQMMIFVNSYTVYLVLEKKEEEKWIRNYKDYEEYNKSEDWKLLNRAYYYMSYLIHNGDRV